jgi:hypothetical protein
MGAFILAAIVALITFGIGVIAELARGMVFDKPFWRRGRI